MDCPNLETDNPALHTDRPALETDYPAPVIDHLASEMTGWFQRPTVQPQKLTA